MQEVDIERLHVSFERCAFHRHLGFELEVLEAGKVKVRVKYSPDLDQAMGILHGGVYAAAFDTATYYAALSHYGFGKRLPLTHEYKLNLLASASKEDVCVSAEVLRAGRNVAVVEAKIHSAAGNLLAVGLASVLVRS